MKSSILAVSAALGLALFGIAGEASAHSCYRSGRCELNSYCSSYPRCSESWCNDDPCYYRNDYRCYEPWCFNYFPYRHYRHFHHRFHHHRHHHRGRR